MAEVRRQILEEDQPKAAPQPAAAAPVKQQFVQISARGQNYRVPDPQWYSLSPTEKSEYLDAVDGAEQKKTDDNLALQSINELMDLLDRREAKAKEREAAKDELIAALVGRVEALEAADRNHRVEASEELAKQQTQLADAVINAASVEASLRAQTSQSQAAHDRMGVEAQSRIQAQEQPISQLEGRVQSSTTLMGERSNAVVAKLADAEGRQAKLDVRIAESEGILSSVESPMTELRVREIARREDEKNLSQAITDAEIKRVVAENFTVAAPSSSVDQLNPKPVQMAPNIASDAMEREVKAALKRGGN